MSLNRFCQRRLHALISGTAPIPRAWGGPTIQAKFEPGTYTLLVDMESMEPISLRYTHVSWIEHGDIPAEGSIADRSTLIEFNSINLPVEIAPPIEERLAKTNRLTKCSGPDTCFWLVSATRSTHLLRNPELQ